MAEFNCTDCARHKGKGRCYVKGRGLVGAGIMIIGDEPGRYEGETGSPFMRDTGMMLDKALAAVGLSRATVFCSHIVRCQGDSEATPSDINACMKHLDREVSAVKPKVIVLLGAQPTRAILGKEATSSVMANVWDSGECVRAFTFAKDSSGYMDERTEETISKSMTGVFRVVVGPSPVTAQGNPAAFKNLIKALDKAVKVLAGSSTMTALDYHYAYDEDQSFRMLQTLRDRCDSEKLMSFDIETSGLIGYKRMHDPHKADVLTCSFAFKPTEAYALTLRPNPRIRTERVSRALKSVLEHPVAKVGHGGNFDNVLVRHDFGIKVRNYAIDTFVAAYALDQDSNAKGLDDLAGPLRPDLGRWWEKTAQHLDKKRYGYRDCPDDLLLHYNACDADATLSVWEDEEPKLIALKRDRLFYEILMPHYREIAEMEYFGVRLDVTGAKAIGRRLVKKIRETEEACLAQIGKHPHWWNDDDLEAHGLSRADFKPFNLSSGPQIANLIYNELKVPVLVKTKANAPSTSLDALEPLKKQHPFINDLLVYRKDEKFLGSFIGWEAKDRPKAASSMDMFGAPDWEPEGVIQDGSGMLSCVGEDGRLRPELHIDGAETGRISITEPALQTIPKTKELRNLLIPADGYVFVDADFKALELRILAMLSGDPEFLRIFREGLDPHSITASKMFGIPIDIPANATKADRDAYFAEWNKKHGDKRKYAKAVNFGIPYGEGAEGLADQLGVPVPEAQGWLNDWATKSFPVAAKWLDRTVVQSRKDGGVTYSMNRFRRLPGFSSPKQSDQSRAERQAKNTPIQGTGGDCTSLAIVRIHERFRTELGENWSDIARIVLEVHDQVVVEVLVAYAERVKQWVIEEMSRRMPFLPDTLTLEVDADIKQKWGD